jgi:ubiquinone/menaquinone biosynthesis C-methylase UbiE
MGRLKKVRNTGITGFNPGITVNTLEPTTEGRVGFEGVGHPLAQRFLFNLIKGDRCTQREHGNSVFVLAHQEFSFTTEKYINYYFRFPALSVILLSDTPGYSMKQHAFDVWLFEVGATAYDLFTTNPVWLANCARLLDHVPAGQQRRVLDLGVGPGASALALGQQRPELCFIGLDFAQAMLKAAVRNRRKAGWSSERLCLGRGDALHLPFQAGRLDAVTGHSFLYLLSDYKQALAEAQRVLRPGGFVAFLEPHAGSVSWSWLSGQVSGRLWVSLSLWRLYSGWQRRFSPQSLSLSLAQAGFSNVKTEVTLGGFGIFGRAQKPQLPGSGS